ncbi:C25 family cysteine peptidase [Hymenobacter sp. BT491]|uniref:putative type IX secretion system sortase PorU2 n=1 Tax=Hymenobacter sp. BT491 TaxID=2766779 RepID=UPI001653EAA4|nr:C25 family cysteine peptidase [Hymenobacter sp. BT491]MBC6989365.1 hypothetical protein [Hymenobacter sp. BT491]
MKQNYQLTIFFRWSICLLLLVGGFQAKAQSGPFGNEWIVPGQQYYKIKVTYDGLHRLDYQYLTNSGVAGVQPSQFQLWRRGKEVAIYVGGNPATFDANTFIEFYGQRNDGQLDRGMYKKPTDQPQNLYSLYTDTAAYFLTWSAGRAGKRMAQPSASATGAAQPYRVQNRLRIFANAFSNVDVATQVYFPWAEAGEGFLSPSYGFGSSDLGVTTVQEIDSIRNIVAGSSIRVEVTLVGHSRMATEHISNVSVVPPSGQARLLGAMTYKDYSSSKRTFSLQRSDIGTDGKVKLQFQAAGPSDPSAPRDRSRIANIRVLYSQANRWFARQRSVSFANDSTLSSPAYYVLDSIPNTVAGFDITDPYNVQRVEGVATAGTQRGFVFPGATDRTHTLLLADEARPFVPGPAKRITFRTITPSAYNFLIISNGVLMKPVGSVTNPVRAYAEYRGSAAGGKYDTLVVTSQQLFDQFHYGEYSALAIRHFAQWMLTNARPKYLLLLGKGVHTGERAGNGALYRQFPEQYSVKDLVPTSTRGPSDNFFSADWEKDEYIARIPTGRIQANTPQQVLNYLSKLKEHEALGAEPWRKNVLHLVGGHDAVETAQFQGYMNRYKNSVEKPCFGGKVIKTYVHPPEAGANLVDINIAPELNAGLSLITYFGHGSPEFYDLNLGSPYNPSTNYNNKGKYPVFIINGCAGGYSYTEHITVGENWTLVGDKGAVGFMASAVEGLDSDLNEYCSTMYQELFNDPNWYGKPMTEVYNEVARRLQPRLASYPFGTALLISTVWQGDPALRLYSPAKPDFVTSNDNLQLQDGNGGVAQATSASFNLNLRESNTGNLCGAENVDIKVTRFYPAGASPASVDYHFTMRQGRQDSTYVLAIPNTPPTSGSSFGANRFVVTLDDKNMVDELSETNNQAELNINLLQGGVTALMPTEFAIVPSTTVRLVGQSNLPGKTARGFEMQLDTVPTFNSNVLQNRVVQDAYVPQWQVTLPAVNRDSVVWYWRLRLQTPQVGEDPEWAVSSFRVINGSTGGWSQSHYGQFARDKQAGLSNAAPSGKWSFANTTQGTITSTLIGRAQQWNSLYQTVRTAPSGSYTLRLIGVDANNKKTVLNPDIKDRVYSLASISAAAYPYLQLELEVRDASSGTAPQLKQWLVTYQGVPEGVARPDKVAASTYEAATLAQQAASTGYVEFPVVFDNVSPLDFGKPLQTQVSLLDENGKSATQTVAATPDVLKADGTATFKMKVNVFGLSGRVSGRAIVNTVPVPEQYFFNNEILLPAFNVPGNTVPPVLDVAFDGQHILNGDIVSPVPVITVQLQSSDRRRAIKDPANFDLFLTKSGQPTIKIDVRASNVVFAYDSLKGTARIDFQPGKAAPLADGTYTLRAQGRGANGVAAGTEAYEVAFQVISASTITNLYPYPNPITSKAKFVFTLTGSELPRNMKIQIMTLTGKVVREIMMDELGPLRIGNNITDFAWDGTDEFGDRLANGTYLYRVMLDTANKPFEHRITAGDKSFKKDWGKLVLLR